MVQPKVSRLAAACESTMAATRTCARIMWATATLFFRRILALKGNSENVSCELGPFENAPFSDRKRPSRSEAPLGESMEAATPQTMAKAKNIGVLISAPRVKEAIALDGAGTADAVPDKAPCDTPAHLASENLASPQSTTPDSADADESLKRKLAFDEACSLSECVTVPFLFWFHPLEQTAVVRLVGAPSHDCRPDEPALSAWRRDQLMHQQFFVAEKSALRAEGDACA
jgi:hypothetical protein